MRRLIFVLMLWALTFAGGAQLIKRGLLPEGPLAWMVALLPWVLGAFVLAAFVRYLRETDELNRQIQLQALALGFGGTYFLVTGYESLERVGAPAAELGDVTLLMVILYSIGCFVGWRRYR